MFNYLLFSLSIQIDQMCVGYLNNKLNLYKVYQTLNLISE